MVPTCEGWFWFRADDRSRSTFASIRLNVWVVLRVSGTPFKSFVVHFPQCAVDVRDLGGEWSGPLVPPDGVTIK